MTKQIASSTSASLLHELAEATQALGNYLSALDRDMARGGIPPSREVLGRALAQYARVTHSLRELRAELNGDFPEDQRPK